MSAFSAFQMFEFCFNNCSDESERFTLKKLKTRTERRKIETEY